MKFCEIIRSMEKYLIGGLIVIFVAFGGFYLLRTVGHVTPSSQSQGIATSTYATTTFSAAYPSDFSINDSYAYDNISPKKLIHGVKFVIPETMAAGTNLSSYDTGVSVEQLPRAKNCTGEIFLLADVEPKTWIDNDVKYSVASTTEAAAGNLYEEQVYALSGSHPCTAVRYFIHSANIANSATSTVREFDRSALLAIFGKIRQSLKLITLQP